MSKGPIGVFDSGYGGLSVLSELQNVLPEYDFYYLGDNARAPYGTRSYDVVHQFTWAAVQKLFELGCPLVILACNTASARALRTIQQQDLPNYEDPSKRVLGVIRPCTEEAGSHTNTSHIGILATEGTVRSDTYIIEITEYHPDTHVTQEACPMWVPLIENGEVHTPAGQYLIQKHVESLFSKDGKIDTLILGCTHYPLIIDEIRKHVPDHVNIIDTPSIVAKSLKDYLQRHPEMDDRLSKEGETHYFTSEDTASFAENAKKFLGLNIHAQHLEF